MEKEIWKDIVGYEGRYKISNYGRVKSLNYMRTGKEKMIKTWKTSCGYKQAHLHKDGKIKHMSVHRLVARAFVDGYKEGLVVNHKDGNKANNLPSNLEWTTYQKNIRHAIDTGLNDITRLRENGKRTIKYAKKAWMKKVICLDTGDVYDSIVDAANDLGCNRRLISAVCLGRRKTTGGYKFAHYVEGQNDE